MPGVRLIKGASFDAESTRLMGVAYEQACMTVDAGNAADRELVATRIIEAARRGERDPAKLAAYGMEGLAPSRSTLNTG